MGEPYGVAIARMLRSQLEAHSAADHVVSLEALASDQAVEIERLRGALREIVGQSATWATRIANDALAARSALDTDQPPSDLALHPPYPKGRARTMGERGPEMVLSRVEQATALPERYRASASHQSMSCYLADWERALGRLELRVAQLRHLRDERKAAADNGDWPPVPPRERT